MIVANLFEQPCQRIVQIFLLIYLRTPIGLLDLFRGCQNIGASAIHRPLSCPLSPEWPGALAQRCGADVVEMDLTYQLSKTFKSDKHIVSLMDLYDTMEGEEHMVHRKSYRKNGK